MRVQLTRKLADVLDGVDLSTRRTGETFTLSNRQGELLIAEGWAVRAPDKPAQQACSAAAPLISEPADTDRSRVQLLARQLEQHYFESTPHRRIEDRVLEELREGREQLVEPARNDATQAERPTHSTRKA